VIIGRLLGHMRQEALDHLIIHWQGGEVLTLSPAWLEDACNLIAEAVAAAGKSVEHAMQTNLLAYHEGWNPILYHRFGGHVGTSVDFPNRHRRMKRGGPAEYDALWRLKLDAARASGLRVGAITVLTQATLDAGAEAFYTHMTEDLGLRDFQINTPFPGGLNDNTAKSELGLDMQMLIDFHLQLTELWLAQGYPEVSIGPMDELLRLFSHQDARLPCIWGTNCADYFVSVDPRGHVAQCDCWVASYPQYRYGNVFATEDFSVMLADSPARQDFMQRPMKLMAGDCLRCDYLSICHGGCPVRTYAVRGTLFEKDPYCPLYKALFRDMERRGREVLRTATALPANAQGKTVAAG
jgi:radical SAM protein with 4Fe4S-binding SPASM domain